MKTQSNTKNLIFISGALMLMVLTLSGCALNADVKQCVSGETYGFWQGLWHGIIAPIDFIVSLFNDKYTVFAPNNNGHWYTFGFILGSGSYGFFGIGRAAKPSNCKKPKMECKKEEETKPEV